MQQRFVAGEKLGDSSSDARTCTAARAPNLTGVATLSKCNALNRRTLVVSRQIGVGPIGRFLANPVLKAVRACWGGCGLERTCPLSGRVTVGDETGATNQPGWAHAQPAGIATIKRAGEDLDEGAASRRAGLEVERLLAVPAQV